jgi:L-2-hydroxyglutarate oxidase
MESNLVSSCGRRDVAVIGGGIVGLATAYAIVRSRPGVRLTVLEKEDRLAAHQSGRNSGVIHSGVYYTPSSAKARLAKIGSASMYAFAREHGIPVEQCGKAIVATSEPELESLAKLEERAAENGLEATRLTPSALRDKEPNVVGLAALWLPTTGVVDFGAVCDRLRALITAAGAEVRTNAAVKRIREGTSEVIVDCEDGYRVRAQTLANCAGLYSDRIARIAGLMPDVQILPFRGEYFELVPDRRHLVRGLIYPVPNPAYPFLGLHLTRGVDGAVHAGPNAVLALAREGYGPLEVNVKDVGQMLSFPGFWRFARRHWRMGVSEYARSLSRDRFVCSLQRLVPAVQVADLVPAQPGVRAQAVRRDGQLVDDFLFAETRLSVHVLNAPSPAATASLPIGAEIGRRITCRLIPN